MPYILTLIIIFLAKTADNMLTQYEESSLRKTLLWESLMAKVAEMSEITETTTEAAVS